MMAQSADARPSCVRCEGTGDLYGRVTGPIAVCPDCGGRGVIPPEGGEPFAWTPDDVMEREVEEFKRLWPEKWEAWLRWLDEEGK